MSEQPLSPEQIRAQVERIKMAVDQREMPVQTAKTSATRIATDVMVCIAVGMFMGYWADQWWQTKPWGILLGLAFGMAAAVRSAIRSNEALEKNEKTESSES
ncbi:MAG: AtpZ/AtpI family protein [Rickettsiales bacterium]|nr:AtpZ/AtpI family protein [Rickettsiales bacterium]